MQYEWSRRCLGASDMFFKTSVVCSMVGQRTVNPLRLRTVGSIPTLPTISGYFTAHEPRHFPSSGRGFDSPILHQFGSAPVTGTSLVTWSVGDARGIHYGLVAKRQCHGLQIRYREFDSHLGLQFASVTQLAECQFSKLDVAGSTPVYLTLRW